MAGGRFNEPEHWRALARGLHIEDRALFEHVAHVDLSPGLAAAFAHDGYLQGRVDWGMDLRLMADTVRSLAAANLSPLFGLLYDEFWYPFFKLHRLIGTLLGGPYGLLPDFWILNVDPKKSEAGWRPHRDKGRRALFDDGSPKSLTVWIPLSAATPLNGCLYVVPAQQDPTYGTPNETEMKFEHQAIRALPGNPGDFIVWNQALFHWGGRTSPAAAESRVSMAFQFQRADAPAFDAPLLDPLHVPPFATRLRLIARQLYRYRHMYELDPELIPLASEVFDEANPRWLA
ncbi:MAG TPA: phytanoyl-CoA dioxygenase family protein [Xanthobacteraceae bacterium]|jgi:hypothetical protein